MQSEFGPDVILYSDGTLARNVPIKVYVSGTNTFASLYSDIAGTIALSNPVSTDAQGNLKFFTGPGTYDLELNGFRVTVTLADFASSGGFAYTQGSSSAQWTIPHSLGRIPSVEVYIAGKLVLVDVDVTTSLVVITFPSPQSGVAVIV